MQPDVGDWEAQSATDPPEPHDHGRYGVVEDVPNRVLRFRPAILTLNEVCAGQFWRLQSRLEGSAWKMSGVFRPQRHDSRCPGGGFGDAVLTAGAVGRREVLPLPNLGPEHRAILCLRTSAGGPVLACTPPSGDRQRHERPPGEVPAKLRRRPSPQQPGRPGGGHRGRRLQPRARTDGCAGQRRTGGRFFDTDPQAAGTHGRKIDYILFSRAHFANPSGGPESSKYSDHKALLGQAARR